METEKHQWYESDWHRITPVVSSHNKEKKRKWGNQDWW